MRPARYRFADFASAFAFAERALDFDAAVAATVEWGAAELDDAKVPTGEDGRAPRRARWAALAATDLPTPSLPTLAADVAPAASLAAEPFVLPRVGDARLSLDAATHACARLGHGWTLHDAALSRRYIMATRAEVRRIARIVAALAEALGHHPVLSIDDRMLDVRISTHDLGGVTHADAVWAARCERLAAQR